MHAVIGVGCELVGSIAVLVLVSIDEVGVLLVVGGERGHKQQALGKGGVEALHAQDAVHAVAAHHLDVVAHVLSVLEQDRRRCVVDRREDHGGAGLLGLGELVGEARGRVVLKGFFVNDLELGLSGLGLKGIGNARRIGVAGVIEEHELLVRILLSQELGSVDALVGVGKANLEDAILALGDVLGRRGRGDHERLGVLAALGGNGNRCARGGRADEGLHTPVQKIIKGVDGLLAVGLIVLGLAGKRKLLGGEILAAKLDGLSNGLAIGGICTGQRADGTDLKRSVARSGTAIAAVGGAAS